MGGPVGGSVLIHPGSAPKHHTDGVPPKISHRRDVSFSRRAVNVLSLTRVARCSL